MKKINQKGITLLILVITIVILLILASITIYTGGNIIQKANLQNINTNMMLIQAKTKTIAEQSKFNKDASGYQGTKISEVMGNTQIDSLVANGIIEDKEKYFLLSQDNLNQMGLEKIKIDEGYVVNYETDEIIYVKGFEANNTIYYKLSEMKSLNIE